MRIISTILVAVMLVTSGCGGGGLESSANTNAARVTADSAVTAVAAESGNPKIPAAVAIPNPTDNLSGIPASANETAAATVSETSLSTEHRARNFSFSNSTNPGWITDGPDFWTKYNLVFTGGGTSYTKPPPAPPNQPAQPEVWGLELYMTPARPNFVSAPLSPPWQDFLDHSMACFPACTMAISDILAFNNSAAGAAARSRSNPIPSEGVTSLGSLDPSYLSLGERQSDNFFNSFRGSPGLQDLPPLAHALDLRAQRLMKAWEQLDKLLAKSVSDMPSEEYQYALMALRDGPYPDVRYGMVQMKVGDVWKFGTSMDPDGRYPAKDLATLSLSMVVQTKGTAIAVLTQEKINLINYFILYGQLPPGNKIFK